MKQGTTCFRKIDFIINKVFSIAQASIDSTIGFISTGIVWG